MLTICLGYNGNGREEYAKDRAYYKGVPLIRFPENGLHPKDIRELVKSWVKNDLDLVVETHSEVLLSELGLAVETGACPSSKIGIHLVTAPWVVQTFWFDKEGTLEGGWPIGYFSSQEMQVVKAGDKLEWEGEILTVRKVNGSALSVQAEDGCRYCIPTKMPGIKRVSEPVVECKVDLGELVADEEEMRPCASK